MKHDGALGLERATISALLVRPQARGSPEARSHKMIGHNKRPRPVFLLRHESICNNETSWDKCSSIVGRNVSPRSGTVKLMANMLVGCLTLRGIKCATKPHRREST